MTELTERERQIVAWLRDFADAMERTAKTLSLFPREGEALRLGAAIRRDIANAIERGEPWGEQA